MDAVADSTEDTVLEHIGLDGRNLDHLATVVALHHRSTSEAVAAVPTLSRSVLDHLRDLLGGFVAR